MVLEWTLPKKLITKYNKIVQLPAVAGCQIYWWAFSHFLESIVLFLWKEIWVLFGAKHFNYAIRPVCWVAVRYLFWHCKNLFKDKKPPARNKSGFFCICLPYTFYVYLLKILWQKHCLEKDNKFLHISVRLSLRFLHALSQWSRSFAQECGYWSKRECWQYEWKFPGLDVIKDLSWTERKKLPYNFLPGLTKFTLISASIYVY